MTYLHKDEPGSETTVSFQAPDEPEADRPLTLEEQRSLAGAAPLVPPEERLDVELPPRGWANAAMPRTLFVAGLMGAFCFLAFSATLLFGGRRKVAEAPAPEPEPIAVAPDRSDQLKTQLALVGQQQDQEKPSSPTVRTTRPPVPQTAKPQPTTGVRPVQAQPIPPRSTPIRTLTKTEVKAPEPEVDPFEQWNALANAGTLRGNVEIEPAAQTTTEDSPTPIAEVKIASATLGSGSLPSMEGVGGASRNENRPSPVAPPEPMEPSIEFSALSPGALGILQRRRSTTFEASTQAEIPMGSRAKAELMTPIIWSGENINMRSAVELKEALKDMEGNEVLPRGTVFITEITNVDEGSRLIEQTAIAILYEKDGQRIQESIPPGLVLILDEDLEPLKAHRVDRRGFSLDRSISQVLGLAGDELDDSDNILGDVAGGALDNLSDRMRPRSSRGDRATALTVRAGKTVSVMINGFLGVDR
jgi:hypothetical protein